MQPKRRASNRPSYLNATMMATDAVSDALCARRFLVGAEASRLSDAAQLRALLRETIGVDAAPTGDAITVQGVHFTVGCEPGGLRTLRVEERCRSCGDPERSLPITCKTDLARFLIGRHRDAHEHYWLSGE